jgi:hypothetical protein
MVTRREPPDSGGCQPWLGLQFGSQIGAPLSNFGHLATRVHLLVQDAIGGLRMRELEVANPYVALMET